MGQVIICDGCDGRPADLLVTSIHDGQVLAFDLQCSGVWAEGHAAAMKQLFADETPEQDGQAGSGQTVAGQDTPDATPPGPEADGAAVLPTEGVPGDEAAAGGENDGRIRGNDRGPEGGDRQAADRTGIDGPGSDRRGGPGGAERGPAGGKRQRTGAAGGKPARQRRTAGSTAGATDAAGSEDLRNGP